MQQGPAPSNFNDLPHDVVVDIFSSLSMAENLAIRRVCRGFAQVFFPPSLLARITMLNPSQQAEAFDLLLKASWFRYPEVIQCLIDKGFDINMRVGGPTLISPDAMGQFDPEHVSHYMLIGCTHAPLPPTFDQVRSIELLLSKKADASARDKNRRTSLHYAAYLGMGEMIRALLAGNADANVRDGCMERIPLHDAAQKGHVDAIQALLAGNDGMCHVRDYYGFTPLHSAADGGHVDAIQVLLAGNPDANVRSNFGCAPLHLAARKRHANAIQALLAGNADVNVQDHIGWTALHYAVHQGHAHVIQALLDGNANANLRNNYGFTSLHVAAYEGRAKAIPVLIAGGADIGSQNNKRKTPLQIAIEKGHTDAALLALLSGS